MSRPVAISWAFVDHRFPLSSTDQRYQSSGRRSTAVCWDCYPSAASTLGLAWVPRWDHHSTASFNDRTSMVVCQVSKGTCRKDQKSMVFFSNLSWSIAWSRGCCPAQPSLPPTADWPWALLGSVRHKVLDVKTWEALRQNRLWRAD